VEKLPLRDVALEVARYGDQVLAGTSWGFAIIEKNQVRRFFLDHMSDGRWRVAEAVVH
jgi:hypothetical protein